MIILNIGLLMPLTVFLYTGFIRALPRDYEEAARVDGAVQLRPTLWRVFPLLAARRVPTVAVLVGVIVWNEFFLPLVIFLQRQPARDQHARALRPSSGDYVTDGTTSSPRSLIVVGPSSSSTSSRSGT